jgi:hypothetical protein
MEQIVHSISLGFCIIASLNLCLHLCLCLSVHPSLCVSVCLSHTQPCLSHTSAQIPTSASEEDLTVGSTRMRSSPVIALLQQSLRRVFSHPSLSGEANAGVRRTTPHKTPLNICHPGRERLPSHFSFTPNLSRFIPLGEQSVSLTTDD